MYQKQIDEKLDILALNGPYQFAFDKWLFDSNLWNALYSCLRIDGIEINKRKLVEMIDGEIFQEMPLEYYDFITRFSEVYKDMQASIRMMDDISLKLLDRWYKMLFDKTGMRQDNPVIYGWNYMPPHFLEVPEKMDEIFRIKRRNVAYEAFCDAVYLNLGILAVYPYGSETNVMALIAMFYELLRAGIPFPSVSAAVDEYDELLKNYFNRHDENGYFDMLERSLLNRLDSVANIALSSK